MTRPIPVFEFVFAAYYATCGCWDEERGYGGLWRPNCPTAPAQTLDSPNAGIHRLLSLHQAKTDCRTDSGGERLT